MNTKLHAVADANGRPLSFFMTAGQVSDYTGAAALLDDPPKAQWLLAGSETPYTPRAYNLASRGEIPN
jgi:transposase